MLGKATKGPSAKEVKAQEDAITLQEQQKTKTIAWVLIALLIVTVIGGGAFWLTRSED